jgi:hypothetical protein
VLGTIKSRGLCRKKGRERPAWRLSPEYAHSLAKNPGKNAQPRQKPSRNDDATTSIGYSADFRAETAELSEEVDDDVDTGTYEGRHGAC